MSQQIKASEQCYECGGELIDVPQGRIVCNRCVERRRREIAREDRVAKLAQEISDFTNEGGDLTKVVEELLNDHPTLQQSFMRQFVRPYLEGMAAKPYVDARNEGSRAFARAALEGAKDTYLPLI